MDIEVQREEAFEDGVAHGEARGETRGLFKGIVATYKEFHISQMEAIQKLTSSQEISQEEATGYVQRYW